MSAMKFKRLILPCVILAAAAQLSGCAATTRAGENATAADTPVNTPVPVSPDVTPYAASMLDSFRVVAPEALPVTEHEADRNQVYSSKYSSDNLWLHALYHMNFVVPPHKSAGVDKRTVNRNLVEGHLFAYYIINELKRRNMPLELIAIPMIESTFNPHAVAPWGTVGIWQFTSGTAKVFKLRVDDSYDMRRDVIASTNAALNYMEMLYKMFGDWNQAVAAYNCGQGTVGNAISRNRNAGKPTDVWSLNIPKHSKEYVSKLYGFTDMIRKGKSAGVIIPDLPFKPVFKIMKLDGKTLRQISSQTGISVERLARLNPGFNSPDVTTTLVDYVLVPVDNNDLLANYRISGTSGAWNNSSVPRKSSGSQRGRSTAQERKTSQNTHKPGSEGKKTVTARNSAKTQTKKGTSASSSSRTTKPARKNSGRSRNSGKKSR